MVLKKLSRIIIQTPNLAKVQDFYSIVGVEWLGGQGKEEIGQTGLPKSVETPGTGEGGLKKGLPDLWGDLNEVEFLFYLNKEMSTVQTAPIWRFPLK